MVDPFQAFLPAIEKELSMDGDLSPFTLKPMGKLSRKVTFAKLSSLVATINEELPESISKEILNRSIKQLLEDLSKRIVYRPIKLFDGNLSADIVHLTQFLDARLTEARRKLAAEDLLCKQIISDTIYFLILFVSIVGILIVLLVAVVRLT